jgi:hypothetical protein
MSAPAGVVVVGIVFGFWPFVVGDCSGETGGAIGPVSTASASSSSSSSSGTSTGTGGAGGEGGATATATTTGAGGAGGQGGEGGQGGAPECLQASDCGQDGPCDLWVCHLGKCLQGFSPQGSIVDGPAGDCEQLVCDGAGGVVPEPHPNDLPPDDGSDCTTEACDPGPVHPPVATGTSCSTNGGALCQAGACVPFIPVVCKVGGQVYNGCDGFVHPGIGITWGNGPTFGLCNGAAIDVAYCPPGTNCGVSVDGAFKGTGKCQ